MLLTSGQVSVAISSVVAALFLSGYVLQQKTVRDIRIAIRPQAASMQERMYLPPQFEKSQIQIREEQDDAVVVNVKKSGATDTLDMEQKRQRRGDKAPNFDATDETEQQEPVLSEDTQTAEAEIRDDPPPPPVDDGKSSKAAEDKPLSAAARRKKIKEEVLAAGEGEGYKGYRRRMW